MRAVVFDTETTGLVKPGLVDLEKQPKIIELGLVIVENNAIVEERNWLINPGEPISAEITKITGITDADVDGMPSFREVWNEASQYFLSSNASVAHNHPFDFSMVDNECKRIDILTIFPPIQICTVQEFAHEFGHRPKLTDLYKKIMGVELVQTHRASDDCKALAECLIKIDFFNAI